MNRRRVFAMLAAGFVLAGAFTIAASPAIADDTESTVWQAWIMPNDGTDWPQLVASDENLAALPCGTSWRIQNDEYLPAERDRFVADGILTYGEDFGSDTQHGAISWHFSEYIAPACMTEVVPVYPTVTQATGQCLDGAWSATAASVTLPAVENGRWLENDPVTLTPPAGEYTFGFTTAEGNYTLGQGGDYQENGVAYFTVMIAGLDPQDCTIPTPTDSAAPQPSADVPASVVADAALIPSGTASAPLLAETGPENVPAWLIVSGLASVLLGTVAVSLGRRKATRS